MLWYTYRDDGSRGAGSEVKMTRQRIIDSLFLIGVAFALWTGWETLAAASAAVSFYHSGQALANDGTVGAAAADLDNNGQLDIVTVSSGSSGPSRIWLNQNGVFSPNGQSLTTTGANDVALADLNDDGAIDAFVARGGLNSDNNVWLNNGSGQFSDSGLQLGSQTSYGVALGDLNGDTLPDAFVANSGANRVYLQQSGGLTDTVEALGSSVSYAVELGDLDGDNDLDAFVANGGSSGAPDKVWLNNGSGQFTDSGQSLGFTWSYDVALGDLDGNNTLDAVTANWVNAGGRVYLNNGSAVYTDTGQVLGSASSLGVDLADFDHDGDLDVILATYVPDGSEVWLNQGNGTFVPGPILETNVAAYAAVADDFDTDSTPDIFLGNFGADSVWLNGIPGLPGAKIDIGRENSSSGDPSALWEGSGDARVTILLDKPAAVPVDVKTRIVESGTTITKTTSFAAGQQTGLVTIANPGPDTSVEVALLTGFSGAPADDFIQTDRFNLLFVDTSAAPNCFLCTAEWFLRALGFNPTFGALHHVDFGTRPDSPQWHYYAQLSDKHSSELATIVVTHPMILIDGYNALEAWTPALETFNGTGDGVVTQDMVDDATRVLERLENNATPELAAILAHEQSTLDLDSWTGLTVTEMWDDVVEKKQPTTLFLPVIGR